MHRSIHLNNGNNKNHIINNIHLDWKLREAICIESVQNKNLKIKQTRCEFKIEIIAAEAEIKTTTNQIPIILHSDA